MMPDMNQDKPMHDEKDNKVKCPACGEMLSLETASADQPDKPAKLVKVGPHKPKETAANMPMDKLKGVITSAKGPSDGAY